MSSLLYYKDAETKHTPGVLFSHWNWAAFLFGPLWLAYRRCYLYALIGFLVVHFFDILMIKSGLSRFYTILAFLPLRILIGYYGTSLYFRVWRQKNKSHSQHRSIIAIIIYSILDALTSSVDYNKPVNEQWDHFRHHYYYRFDVTPPLETPFSEEIDPENDYQAQKDVFDDLQDV